MNPRSVHGGSRVYATALMVYSAATVMSGRESACAAIRFPPIHQVLDEILKYGRIELVVDFLAVPFGRDQAGVFQDAEMSGDRGPARVEPRRDLAGGAWRSSEEPEDLAPRRIRHRAEDGVPHLHT